MNFIFSVVKNCWARERCWNCFQSPFSLCSEPLVDNQHTRFIFNGKFSSKKLCTVHTYTTTRKKPHTDTDNGTGRIKSKSFRKKRQTKPNKNSLSECFVQTKQMFCSNIFHWEKGEKWQNLHTIQIRARELVVESHVRLKDTRTNRIRKKRRRTFVYAAHNAKMNHGNWLIAFYWIASLFLLCHWQNNPFFLSPIHRSARGIQRHWLGASPSLHAAIFCTFYYIDWMKSSDNLIFDSGFSCIKLNIIDWQSFG